MVQSVNRAANNILSAAAQQANEEDKSRNNNSDAREKNDTHENYSFEIRARESFLLFFFSAAVAAALWKSIMFWLLKHFRFVFGRMN